MQKFINLKFVMKKYLLPENSLRNRLYCRYIQAYVHQLAEALQMDSAHGVRQTFQVIKSRYLPSEVRKILAIMLDHTGDFILGFPAYGLLRESFPDAEITLLCGAWNKDLSEASQLFDRVVCVNLLQETSGECTTDVRFDQEVFDRLNLIGFDIAIDFRDSGETRFLLDKVHAKFRAGFYAHDVTGCMDLCFPSSAFHLSINKKTHCQTLQTLLVGAVVALYRDNRRAYEILRTIAESEQPTTINKLGKGPIVGLNVESGVEEKNWPLDQFINLGLHLIRQLDATLVLFGSKAQEGDSKILVEALPPSNVILCNKLSLRQCVSTMQKLDAYIGNDTGTTHIAAGLNIPTICLSSGFREHDSHGVRGANCVSILTNKEQGMEFIGVNHVMIALLKLLGTRTIESPADSNVNLIVIGNKSYSADFRKHLMRAAEHCGASAIHICCSRETIISMHENTINSYACDTAVEIITESITKLLRQRNTIILTGLNLSAERLTLVRHLKASFVNVKVLYDVSDYYRYGATGYLFQERRKLDMIWQQESDGILILEKGLNSFYPKAFHFDNASHILRSAEPAEVPANHLVYVGSIDSRVDFEWLDALASHAITLDIYGRVHEAAPYINHHLNGFIRSYKNVTFKGSYDNDNLPSILAQYKIGIAPYKVNHTMTDHINPDKIYHYLNAGLEVLATPIPQARRMAQFIHLAPAASDISVALQAAQSAPRNSSWPINLILGKRVGKNCWDSSMVMLLPDRSNKVRLRRTPWRLLRY